MSGDLRQITYSVSRASRLTAAIPNLTTLSRSPPNYGESRLQHGTITEDLHPHTLTHTTKLTLRFRPACIEVPHRTSPSGVWPPSYCEEGICVPSSNGAGELRRTRSALHWRLWHARGPGARVVAVD